MRLLLSTLKFIAGFISNLATQAVRSAFNAGGSLVLLSFGVLCATLALLQLLGGGRKNAKATASSACSLVKASFKMGFASIVQSAGVLTLLSPLARAAQAHSESIWPSGVFTPIGQGRNFWQSVFGMNSWTSPAKEVQVKTDGKKAPQPKNPAPQKKAASKQQAQTVRKLPVKKKTKAEEQWPVIVEQYLKAKTLEESRRLMARMATEFPVQYARALEAASKPKRSSRRAA